MTNQIPRERLHPPPVNLRRVEETLRTRYWSFIWRGDQAPRPSLLEFLKESLPHIDPTSWDQRFEFGGIYVNGIAALQDQGLPDPARIEYYEPKFEISEAHRIFPLWGSSDVLFHDQAIAVVWKPPHLPSMPAKEQRHFSLKRAIERELKCVVHMPSRLDVSAQGLVVLSTAPSAHAGLQRAFETRTVRKTYRFATEQRAGWQHCLVDINIAQSHEHPVLRTISEHHGHPAQTELAYSHDIDHSEGLLHAYTAHPITGRTHQIRVHAAAAGVPILGDNFYGGAHYDYLHLVSCEVSFPHPITGRTLSFSLPSHFGPDWVSPKPSTKKGVHE